MANRNQTEAQDTTPDAGFPPGEKVDSPPVTTRVPNPAIPVVRDAHGQGWLKFTSADEKAATKQRHQVSRAGQILGVKARTRTHKDENGKQNPRVWYLLVEDKPSQADS